MSSETTTGEALIPIRTLSAMTGVNSMTLRAWERRYGLIKPIRTQKGHRLYSQEHVDLIHLVLRYIEKGIPVSQVKDALKQGNKIANTAPSFWQDYRTNMLKAVRNFNANQLDAIYHQALALYPIDFVTQNLVLPLLQEIKQHRNNQHINAAEYSFAYTYIRNKLGARFHHQMQQNSGAKFIAATLPSEEDDIELLAFCLSTIANNLQPTCLGKISELTELPEVLTRTRASGIVFIGTLNTANMRMLAELKRKTKKPVLITGNNVLNFFTELKANDILPLSGDTQTIIKQLTATLSS